MARKIIIAIDGYSSTGKSTVAKQLASALGYVYVDTGAMYRAVTLYALQEKLLDEEGLQESVLVQRLADIKLHFQFNATLGFSEMYLNGKDVEKAIRGMQVSQYVSKIASISAVRAYLVKQQQVFGEQKGIVMDGRDIGTVVFPQAELKFFMTASAQTRAQRRFEELQEKGEEVSYEAVLQNIEERDRVDSTRKDSPLRMADDAIEIDNSTLSLEEQFEKMMKIAQNRIAESD